MDLRVAAYAVVERRGKILLTHWRRGHLHGWTLPGGGIDPGEDPRDAVVREVLEETGLEAKVGKLLGIDSRVMVREEVPEGTDPELHTIRIVYRATVKDGPLRHEIGGSSDEARWVPLREIKALRTLSLVQTSLHMAGINLRKQAPKAAQPKQADSKQTDSKQTEATQTEPKQTVQAKQTGQKSGQSKQGQSKRGGQRSRQRSGSGQRQRGEQATAQNSAQGAASASAPRSDAPSTGVVRSEPVRSEASRNSTPRTSASRPRRANRPAGE